MSERPSSVLRHVPASVSSYYGSVSAFEALLKKRLAQLSQNEQELLSTWVGIGLRNPWISEACDPPFSGLMIEFCATSRALVERLLDGGGRWCLGQGFAVGDLCLINQIDGYGEWLTIKGNLAFESITIPRRGSGFESMDYEDQVAEAMETIEALQRASLEQCRRLEWVEPYRIASDYKLTANQAPQSADRHPSSAVEPSSWFEYSYRDRDGLGQEFRERVSTSPELLRFVIANSVSRYLISVGSGQLWVEQVAGVSPVRRWDFPFEVMERIAGYSFLDRDGLRLFDDLLPFLR